LPSCLASSSTPAYIGVLSDTQVKGGLAAQKSFDRLSNTLQGLKDQIGASLSPAIREMSDSLRIFIKGHAEDFKRVLVDIAVAIRDFDWKGWGTSIKDAAIQVNEIVKSLGGWKVVLAGLVVLKVASWLAPIVTATLALATAIKATTVASLAFSATPLGLALLAGTLAVDALKNTVKPLNQGEDEPARQHRYGQRLGRGQRELLARAGHGDGFHPISGSFADIAQNYRAETSTYKGNMQGAKEGILAAFQQLLNDRNFGLGGGGLGGGLAGAGGGLGGIGGGGIALRATAARPWAARMPGSGLSSVTM
jgi:hypothetical protein